MHTSDGLDSFAVARLVAARHYNVSQLILVTTGNRKNHALDESNSDLSRSMYRVAIPFRLSSRGGLDRHSRAQATVPGLLSLVVVTWSVLLPICSSATQIFVAESGQGAFGPWFGSVGNRSP